MKQVFVKTPSSQQYPAICVTAENHAHGNLVHSVQRVVQNIDLADCTLFPESHRQFFRLIRQVGGSDAIKSVVDIPDKGNLALYIRKQDVLHRLGLVIYDRLDEVVKRSLFPFHNIDVVPIGHEWQVRIRSLLSRSVHGQTFYYSPRQPTVQIDGQKRPIAFTYHAIQQVCERLVPDWTTYIGLADAYAFFADCIYFEPVSLYPCYDNPAGLGFTFFNTCALNFFRPEIINVPCEYALKVIGFSAMLDYITKGTRWFYRVGYGSCELLDDFIVAKTILYPGHRTTPEYGLLLNSKLSSGQKKEMREIATRRDQRVQELMVSGDYSFIKWFHDNGVPQVISLPHDVFASPLADNVIGPTNLLRKD
jgi:hypothetical protein